VLPEVQIPKAKPEWFQDSFTHITETSTGVRLVMNYAGFQIQFHLFVDCLEKLQQYETNAISQFNNKNICFIVLAAD
jgi:hypothetical protein